MLYFLVSLCDHLSSLINSIRIYFREQKNWKKGEKNIVIMYAKNKGKNHGAALRERANNTLVGIMHVRLCVYCVCVSERVDLSYE